MSMTSITHRIDEDLKSELQKIAKFDKRSTSFCANQAIQNYVEERRATRELIKLGLEMIEKESHSYYEADDIHKWLSAEDDTSFPALHKDS